MFRSNLERRAQGGQRFPLPERLVTMIDPESKASEAFRMMRTNLLHTDPTVKAVVLTSPGPKEGKSTVCANLGVTLAQAKKNVLIMDCNLRKPAQHRIFETQNVLGVTNVLMGECGLAEVLHEPLANLKVASAGPVPNEPAELLGSERFHKLLRQARRPYDFVLLDAPAMDLVSDPAILAAQSDGVLLVIDSQGTRKAALQRSIRSLNTVGASLLGTVMNNFAASGGVRYGSNAGA